MVFGLPFLSLDTLLSLPVVSYFFLPSALSSFSWTTSLNILFFYIAWASIVLSHDPLNIEFFGTLGVRTVFYVAPCLLFLALDTLVPSLSTNIKFHGRRARPLTALGSRKAEKLAYYFAVCLFNVLLGIVLQGAIEYTCVHLIHMRSALRISTTLPMPLTLGKDLTRAYLIRGPLAYYIHKRLLHDSRNSKHLTRLHKTWQHSLRTTLPFSASYDHSLVYLVHRWLPIYLPAVIFRMHMLTYMLFLTLISLEEAFAWSGYSVLPSTIMLAGIARRTEAHLMTGGGNYGPWGVMDWVHGTTLGNSDVMDDLQEEVEKRDVKGKAKRAGDKASIAAANFVDIAGDEGEEGDQDVGLVTTGRQKFSRALRRKK